MKEFAIYCYVVALILYVLAMLSGCQPEQQWGKGELPSDYAGFFGIDNMARLNFVQTERINLLGRQLTELAALNSEQHKILGQSDIDLYARVKRLEGRTTEAIAEKFFGEEVILDGSGPTGPLCGRAEDKKCRWVGLPLFCVTHGEQ